MTPNLYGGTYIHDGVLDKKLYLNSTSGAATKYKSLHLFSFFPPGYCLIYSLHL